MFCSLLRSEVWIRFLADLLFATEKWTFNNSLKVTARPFQKRSKHWIGDNLPCKRYSLKKEFYFRTLAEISHQDSNRNDLNIRSYLNAPKAKDGLQRIAQRTSGDAQIKAMESVQKILSDVQRDGDQALIHYTKTFDNYNPEPLIIEEVKLKAAWEELNPRLKEALKLAHKRIENFHKLQLPKDIYIEGDFGEMMGRRWQPVERAGIYIPGGRAAYPSTVLMNAIPAKVAGVEELIMASPGDRNGEISEVVLGAAHLAGIRKVLRVGGAQSIGGLAFGTESINAVDVITGPGNIYVTLAKKFVYGQVGIDSLAGPSEVLIIADETASYKHIASDLLAQAEHDPLAAAILLTTDSHLAKQVPIEINKQLKNHPRSEICQSSLEDWGAIIVCDNIDICIELSNFFAPEHLEILIKDPKNIISKIKNAGAIFIGKWSPEAVGDYLAGPNHTLPTSGTARFSGALCVETFMKNTSLIEFNEKALKSTADSVIELALSEGLNSHAESVKIRLGEKPI